MQKNHNLTLINTSSMIAFFLGVAGVFLFLTMQALDITPARLISPLIKESKGQTIKDMIIPKLSIFKNRYSIRSESSFVGKAHAEGQYQEASAYAAIEYDTGKVIVGENIDEKLPVASLTKIMSAVVALDLAEGPDDLFTVSKHASEIEPTKIGVVEGQKMKLVELLHATLLTSANDAVQVISDGVDKIYGEGAFILAMNEKAKILGLHDTRFSNPQGFDSKNNFSTVSDLAVLSHYALTHYPLIKEIVKKDYEFLAEDSNHKQFDLYNWNGLIGVYPDTIGLKIGNTGRAKHTTVVLSERGGKRILAVVLGAPRIQERDLWASQILDDGYQILARLEPLQISEETFLEKYRSWKYFN